MDEIGQLKSENAILKQQLMLLQESNNCEKQAPQVACVPTKIAGIDKALVMTVFGTFLGIVINYHVNNYRDRKNGKYSKNKKNCK